MELTQKGKILKNYARSLADTYFIDKKELRNSQNRNFFQMRLNAMCRNVNLKLEEIYTNFNSKDSKKVANYFAEKLIEKGHLNFAYIVYKKSNSKKARTIERLFSEEELKLKNPPWN